MRKALLCALALLLAGCDKDFLVLHFDMPAGNPDDSRRVHQPLHDSILAPLKARNLPTDSLAMEIDRYNAKVVHLRLTDNRLSAQQLDEIRETYEAIIPARNAVTLKVRLTFDTSRLQAPKGFDPAALAPLERSIVLAPSITQPPYDTPALRLEPGSDGQTRCTFVTYLAPTLPFQLIRFEPGATGPGDHGLLQLANRDQMTAQVPLHMAFSDAALRRQLEQGSVRVLLSAKHWGHLGTPQKDRLHFVLGPPIKADKHAARSASAQAQCLKRLHGIGRPFTFFMGDNLDRLTYISLPAKG